MIAPDQHYTLFLVLLAASLFGIIGERKGWFKRISGVLMTILLMAVIASIGLVPSASDAEISVPVYDFVFTYFVPISIPLLLFNVQLKKIIQESGRLLIAFLIGSIGVVIGAFIASSLLDAGPETYKLAGVFVGTYTGGSVNFMSVAAILDFLESPLFPSTIAVDNVFTNFYIMLLFILPSFKFFRRFYPAYTEDGEEELQQEEVTDKRSLLERVTLALMVTFAICAAGFYFGPIISRFLNTEINLDILIITLLITAAANIFPGFLQPIAQTAFDLGIFFLYIFLAVIGAASDLREMFITAPVILAFASILLSIHLVFVLFVGRILKFSIEEICVASCANAAGVSVAAPMAASFGMKKTVTPAILVSILGYVIGTILGMTVGLWLQ
jgi:uncharacterized membrane protein